MYKKIFIIPMILFIVLFLFSCSMPQQNSESIIDSSELFSSNSCSSISTILSYDIYQQGGANNEISLFNFTMINNPISKQMQTDLLSNSISSTQDAQVFFSHYIGLWQNELSFSINNLKNYLSKENAEKFDSTQLIWFNSINSSNEFDQSIIKDHEIILGTQYSSSVLIHLIDQYSARVFHIKYLTYLAEEFSNKSIPDDEQTWNIFQEIT